MKPRWLLWLKAMVQMFVGSVSPRSSNAKHVSESNADLNTLSGASKAPLKPAPYVCVRFRLPARNKE